MNIHTLAAFVQGAVDHLILLSLPFGEGLVITALFHNGGHLTSTQLHQFILCGVGVLQRVVQQGSLT